jgi:hypothetical protein
VVILASAIYMVWQAQSMRLLSSTLPPAATLETPLPHYLRREAAADPGDAEADAFTTVPRLSRLEERHESNVHDVEWSASPPHPASIGTRITNELQIAFRRGDTARLSELFVQTEQTAHALARQLQPLFAEPLMSEGKRLWLVVTDMDWQYAPEGWIHGRGLAVAASPGPGGTWQEVLHGAVELELIPIASEYRIHSLRFLED